MDRYTNRFKRALADGRTVFGAWLMSGTPATADAIGVSGFDFLVVDMDNGVSIDFMEKDGPIAPQHYAFLVGDPEFDAIYGRIKTRGVAHWADPARRQPGEINHHFGGRGVYFEDPDGHFLEAITKPYARD